MQLMFNDAQLKKLIAFQNGKGTLKFVYIDHDPDSVDVFFKDESECEVCEMTLQELLEEINEDHSDEWTPYDETDWLEGMYEWTNWNLVWID